MDYSHIAVAKRVLEVAGIPIPNNEEDVRKKAFEYLGTKDFLAAHSIRLAKNYTAFNRDDWKEVMEKSGENAIKDNMAAFAACMRYGLLT